MNYQPATYYYLIHYLYSTLQIIITIPTSKQTQSPETPITNTTSTTTTNHNNRTELQKQLQTINYNTKTTALSTNSNHNQTTTNTNQTPIQHKTIQQQSTNTTTIKTIQTQLNKLEFDYNTTDNI